MWGQRAGPWADTVKKPFHSVLACDPRWNQGPGHRGGRPSIPAAALRGAPSGLLTLLRKDPEAALQVFPREQGQLVTH